MIRKLDVYLYNVFAGQLSEDDSGIMSFQYDSKYIGEEQPVISLSMPLQKEIYQGRGVKAFFSGVLPEATIRETIARNLGISKKNDFSLLGIIGRECAGAVSLYPQGEKLQSIDSEEEEVSGKPLEEILKKLRTQPLLASSNNGYRLSLAGAQQKLPVRIKEDKIFLVKGLPTTHIIKPMIETLGIEDSVHNELFCMKLAMKVGLDVPEAKIMWANKTPFFVVKRYDRIENPKGEIQRLHQEDFCQAMGILPEYKYQREGGPSIDDCLLFLKNNSHKPAADQIKFISYVIFNYLIGNRDAHGKNFSMLYQEENIRLARLSPAYDLLSTEIYADLDSKMAMKIGKKYKPKEVLLLNWDRIVPDSQTARRRLHESLEKIATKCKKQSVILKNELEEQGVSSRVFSDIVKLIDYYSDRVLKKLNS